jgi:hypothetical protein
MARKFGSAAAFKTSLETEKVRDFSLDATEARGLSPGDSRWFLDPRPVPRREARGLVPWRFTLVA